MSRRVLTLLLLATIGCSSIAACSPDRREECGPYSDAVCDAAIATVAAYLDISSDTAMFRLRPVTGDDPLQAVMIVERNGQALNVALRRDTASAPFAVGMPE